MPDGRGIVCTSSQAPFSVKKRLSKLFNIPEGNIIIQIPLVGGGFGGKAAVQLEILAYLTSKTVDGKMVSIANSRESEYTNLNDLLQICHQYITLTPQYYNNYCSEIV